jgi:hypothetical protein
MRVLGSYIKKILLEKIFRAAPTATAGPVVGPAHPPCPDFFVFAASLVLAYISINA